METATENILPEIVRRIVDEFDPEEIILFGSRAWGEPVQDSDYDLLIIIPHSDELRARRATRAYRALRGIKVPIDVIVSARAEFDRFSGVRASLEAEILERGKKLYGRKRAGAGSELAPEGIA
jgi:uncharacterized protein